MWDDTRGSCPACCPVQSGHLQDLTARAASPGQGQGGRTRLGRFGSAAGQGPRVPPGGSSLTPAAFLPPSAGISATGCAVQQIQLQLSLVVRAAVGRARLTTQGNHRHTQAMAERRRTAPPCLPRHQAPRSCCRPVALCRALPRGRQQPRACPTFWSTAARPRACIAQLLQNKGGWGRTGWLPASTQRTQRLRARCGAWRCAAGELGWRPQGWAPGAAGGQGAGRDGAGRGGAGRDGAGRGGAGRQQRHHPHPDGKLGL